MDISRRRPHMDFDIEKKLLTGMIVSDRVLSHLFPIVRPDLLALEYAKKVASWIHDYFIMYKKAPQAHIQDIFNERKLELSGSDQELVGEFLQDLSKEYLDGGAPFNDEYVIDAAVRHLKRRHLINIGNEVVQLASMGKIDEAEGSLAKFGRFTSGSRLSKWVKPLEDLQFVNDVFDTDTSDDLFKPTGKFGELVGPIKRGWLIGLMGPMKRGKTWGLQDIALEAVMNKLRTVLISLEMSDRQLALRHYHGLGSFTKMDGEYTFPCFDCIHNATNECIKPERTNTNPRPLIYHPHDPYQPCTACRDKDYNSYSPTTWFENITRIGITRKQVIGLIRKFTRMYGRKLFRQISYPAFSACLRDIRTDIDTLEFSENFVPDVIVIDYADILAPEDPSMKKLRDQIDVTWKTLKQMASERKCGLFTGTQGSRATFEIETIHEKHTPEDIRKLAHVDAMWTLNQTEQEKIACITRIGLLNHRHKEFNKRMQAIVLQQFEAGQFHLDSELIYYKSKAKEGSKDVNASYADRIPRRRLGSD